MTQYWKKIETDLRLDEDYATIHKSDPHMLQQPYLFDKKPPGAPATYPFLVKKPGASNAKVYNASDIRDMDYMHNLIKMLHNKDKTIGTSLMDEIKNNTLMLREDPNTMINRKKHYEELANYERQRLFVRGKKRKILHAVPVLQPSIYIDTSKETFDKAFYNVATFISMTASFTVDKGNDFHPGSRLQRYHNSLYARAQGMLNKISGKQEAINQYRIRHIRREWEHYANMFNYDFMHLPPGYDPLPPTNCWISKTNMKFLKIDQSYHNDLLTKDWDIEDYLYFDPTLLEDAAGYEAWKVWAEKEKKQYAKLCMEEFEKPSDWTLGAGAPTLEPGPPFKLNKLRRFKKDGKRARVVNTAAAPPPQTPPPTPPQTPPPTPPAITPAAIQAAVDDHILDIQATVDRPALDALVNANLTTLGVVPRTLLSVAQQTAIGQAIVAQELSFNTPTPPVTPVQAVASEPFAFAKITLLGATDLTYRTPQINKEVLEINNIYATRGYQLAGSLVKSIVNSNPTVDYIVLSPNPDADDPEKLKKYYKSKWGMHEVGSSSKWKLDPAVFPLVSDPNVTYLIVSVDELIRKKYFKELCGIGGKGGLLPSIDDSTKIDLTIPEYRQIVKTTKLKTWDNQELKESDVKSQQFVNEDLKAQVDKGAASGHYIYYHRGKPNPDCLTVKKCEAEYKKRFNSIKQHLNGTKPRWIIKEKKKLIETTKGKTYDYTSEDAMKKLLHECDGALCAKKDICDAEHPEVIKKFVEKLMEFITNEKDKINKAWDKEKLNERLKVIQEELGLGWKVERQTDGSLILLRSALDKVPINDINLNNLLTSGYNGDPPIEISFQSELDTAKATLEQMLEAVATAPPVPEAPDETAETLKELDVIELIEDPTWDNANKCCRFTIKNNPAYYVRTYKSKKEEDHHSFVSELEKCYQKNQKLNINRVKRKSRSATFKHLMPLHLFTVFRTVGDLVIVDKKNDIGGKLYNKVSNGKFRGLKLKFPSQTVAPDTDTRTNTPDAFYIQKKRGITVKEWIENKYYDLSSDKKKVKGLLNDTFGPATEKLQAPMNDIRKIRDGVKQALVELHSINDCESNNTDFRYLHRDIKIDNVAVVLDEDGKVDRVRLFDYNAVVDTTGFWMQKAAGRNQMPMRNGTYDGGAEYKSKKLYGSLMDRYTTPPQFRPIPKPNLKLLDYHQAGMMLLQLGGIFDWVPDYTWDRAVGTNDNRGIRPPMNGDAGLPWVGFEKPNENPFDSNKLINFWENILRNDTAGDKKNPKKGIDTGMKFILNNKQTKKQYKRADWFIKQGRKLNDPKWNANNVNKPAVAQTIWNLEPEFVANVFTDFFKTQNEIMTLSSGSVGGSGTNITSPIQFLSQARQPVFERIQIQSDYGDDEDLEALMEFDPDLDGIELEKMSPSSHISDEEFERMLNETSNYDALSEHIERENKAYSDHSTDMEVEEDAKSVSSKHSSNSVASIASQMSNMSSHSVASNMSAQSDISVASNMSAQSDISVASNLSEKSNASTMSNMSHHSYKSNHSVESEEAYPTSEHSEQSYGGYSELSYNNNTSGFSNSSSHSSSESSGKEMGYTNGLSESSDHGMSESSDRESSNESMGYNSSGGSSSNNHSYNSSSDTE